MNDGMLTTVCPIPNDQRPCLEEQLIETTGKSQKDHSPSTGFQFYPSAPVNILRRELELLHLSTLKTTRRSKLSIIASRMDICVVSRIVA